VWYMGKDLHFAAHMCARDVWAAWSLVFVDKRAARAILCLPPPPPPPPPTTTTTGSSTSSGNDDTTNNTAGTSSAAATAAATSNRAAAPTVDAADVARAKYIATTLHTILSRRWNVSDERDHGSRLEGLLNQVVALIQHRLVELKIITADSFVKMLKLKGYHKRMYQDIALPVAKAMMLTTEEFKMAKRGPTAGRR
jgi:hypothetical protein